MIKQGYVIEVTSWENDADCYNTKRIDGLTEQEVVWRVNVLKALGAYYNTKGGHVLAYPFPPDLAELIFAELSEVAKLDYYSGYELDKGVDDNTRQEVASNVLYDMLGVAYESDYQRVMEYYKIYLYAEALPDLSAEF
jgi:hypothetical protein